MSIPFLISSICYGCIGFILIIFGLIYSIKNQFMPYHSQALGLSWSDLEENMQVLILALMRAAGGGFLAAGIAIVVLLMIPWQAEKVWTLYAIPGISLSISLGTLSATLLVKTKTPGNPPVILSFVALILTIIGFIFSFI